MNLQTWISKFLPGRHPEIPGDGCRGPVRSASGKGQLFLFFPLLLFLVPTLIGGCSAPVTRTALYLPAPLPADIPPLHAPSFLVENPQEPFNRIGTPMLEAVSGSRTPKAVVDPERSAIFFDTSTFTTTHGSYTNLVYRIHFSRVPFGWNQLNLTTGSNPGLLLIYTLSAENRLLLVTSLHTCGCYLAFFPTNNLPRDRFPANWPEKSQHIYGYTLPALLKTSDHRARLSFRLADGTHRIKGVRAGSPDTSTDAEEVRTMLLTPMASLYQLPFRGGRESFFETEGSRQGYVRNSSRPLEFLLLSWWALDPRVGQDKAYLGGDSSPTPLYTSLKFWARQDSDLKDFPRFLQYWGWTF